MSDLSQVAKQAKAFTICTGAEFTPDHIEFQKAMDEYKRKYNRPFPGWYEVLAVLESLGYRKVPHGGPNYETSQDH